ncbi:Secreted protein [Metarhizium anisopliae]|nr:Secreted protein [Metarhizium anisopliae]
MSRRDMREPRGIVRRQDAVVPGYTTEDDWGTDGTFLLCRSSLWRRLLIYKAGDDTQHSDIPSFSIPGYWEARASFPQDGSNPDKVDLIFFDFIQNHVLADLGAGFTADMVHCYINCTFTSQDFMLPYAKLAWQENYTSPFIRTLAVRINLADKILPSSTSVPTSSLPLGCAIVTASSLIPPGLAATKSAARVPGIRADAPRHSAKVNGTALCAWPMDMATHRMSTPSGVSPPGKRRTILGTLSTSGSRPILAAPARRICSRRALSAASASIAAGVSADAVARSSPRPWVDTKTPGLPTSTSDARTRLPPGSRSVSTGAPVGSALPVLAPAGSTKLKVTTDPAPGTPSMTYSPSGAYLAGEPDTRKRETTSLDVLVLNTRTVAQRRPRRSVSTGADTVSGPTRPWSQAAGPTMADMLPQLPALSSAPSRIPTCTKV